MIQQPVRVVAPAEPVVPLSDALSFVRVEEEEAFALVEGILASAIERLDGWGGTLGRCLVTQTWRQDRSVFPDSDVLRLPFPQVQSASVAYTDPDGADQTFAAVHLAADVHGALLRLASGAAWPAVADRPDAVRVTMVAGYGGPSQVPAAIRQAIRIHVLAEHDRAWDAVRPQYEDLIAPYRWRSV